VERTIVDLNKAKRRRIALWTPWGAVPTDRVRLKGSEIVIREKRDIRDRCRHSGTMRKHRTRNPEP
jgi:hypothetical protein